MRLLHFKITSFPLRRESSEFIQKALRVCPCYARNIFYNWIPACTGMTQ